jgi:hypothetical protein
MLLTKFRTNRDHYNQVHPFCSATSCFFHGNQLIHIHLQRFTHFLYLRTLSTSLTSRLISDRGLLLYAETSVVAYTVVLSNKQRLFAVYNTLTQRLYQTEHTASLPSWQVTFVYFPKLSNSTFTLVSSFVGSSFLPKILLAFFGTVSQSRMFTYSFQFHIYACMNNMTLFWLSLLLHFYTFVSIPESLLHIVHHLSLTKPIPTPVFTDTTSQYSIVFV